MEDTKLVALIMNASSRSRRSLVSEIGVAQTLRCTCLDYDDFHPLISASHAAADKGKLNAATYGVLRRMTKTQLSFGRSVLVVCPIEPNEYRAHLHGLRVLADSHGVPLLIVELRGESGAEETDEKVTMSEVPHQILFLGDFEKRYTGTAISSAVEYSITRFVNYFERARQFRGNCSHGSSDSAKFRHFSHLHPLLLNPRGDGGYIAGTNECCSVCTAPVTGADHYSCPSGDFFLHRWCAELPQNIETAIHTHPLRLVAMLWEKKGHQQFKHYEWGRDIEMKCIICDSGEEQQPFYGCSECVDLLVHYECISSFRHVVEHGLHPHPLKLKTQKADQHDHDFACYACGGQGNTICFSCEVCKFDFHLKCIENLPPSVNHDCHKEHPLLLSMPPKDETDEYYCEVCAKRRHPDYWIYYCNKCRNPYEAHPHCVIQGIPPYTHDG